MRRFSTPLFVVELNISSRRMRGGKDVGCDEERRETYGWEYRRGGGKVLFLLRFRAESIESTNIREWDAGNYMGWDFEMGKAYIYIWK